MGMEQPYLERQGTCLHADNLSLMKPAGKELQNYPEARPSQSTPQSSGPPATSLQRTPPLGPFMEPRRRGAIRMELFIPLQALTGMVKTGEHPVVLPALPFP